MQRTFKFKAWDRNEKLLVRLNTIDCKKGELFKKNHILLQFTGLLDKNEAEVYEHDILLLGSIKYEVVWNQERLEWAKIPENSKGNLEKLTQNEVSVSMKLCNFYESSESFIE